jgi:protein-tyrosine phosphatase
VASIAKVTDALPPLPAERHIPLEGSVNFRDLGGYVGLEGRSIKWRHLFRADGLSHLSHKDHEVIRHLGVATIIDLRTDEELKRDRFDTEATPVTFHHAPLLKSTHRAEDFKDQPFLLGDTYIGMLSDASHEIRRAVEVVADEANHPVIFHCAAGKDRTGVLAALLLGLVGVSDEVIIEDYSLTARAMGALRELLIERRPDLRDRLVASDAPILSAAPENMRSLLDIIEERWGSIPDYAAAIGISDETIGSLRSALLEPA